jgi:hypothetical protein
MAADLRLLTRREREKIGRHVLQHGKVAGVTRPIVDTAGSVGFPAVRDNAGPA